MNYCIGRPHNQNVFIILRVLVHGTDTLVMERPLDCLRSGRTRNELADSRQDAERRSVLLYAVILEEEVLPRCALPKIARASSKMMILRLWRETN